MANAYGMSTRRMVRSGRIRHKDLSEPWLTRVIVVFYPSYPSSLARVSQRLSSCWSAVKSGKSVEQYGGGTRAGIVAARNMDISLKNQPHPFS